MCTRSFSTTKKAIAKPILENLWETRTGRISAQVLLEFHWVLLRKFKLSIREVAQICTPYQAWCGIDTSPRLITHGRDLMEKYKITFLDSLILAGAIACNSELIFSEDFNHGQIYDGIKLVNPFINSPIDKKLNK